MSRWLKPLGTIALYALVFYWTDASAILGQLSRARLDLNVDVYNAFNSDAVLTHQNAFTSAWQLPLSVVQPRFVKFSARWDF